MQSAADIAAFLATRWAKLTPEQVGLPIYGQRRVAGLRREEVAALAGVSADYYRRLERGQVTGVSEQVLEALARALRLDDAERTHRFDLVRASSPVARMRRRPAGRTGRKRLHHPVVGELDLSYETLTFDADDGLGMSLYTAEAGSPSEQALDMLASWTTTSEALERRPVGEVREH